MRISYSDQLKDPRWQRKRLKIMEYADFRCQICGSKTRTLHVHHSYYLKGKKPWQYPDGSLICVCDVCHDKIHDKKPSHPPKPPEPETEYQYPEGALITDPISVKDRFDIIFAALDRATE